MSSEQSAILENAVLVIFIISLFMDFVLRAAWNKIYFTIGVPIFVMRAPVSKKYKGVPYQRLFEEKFQSNWFAQPLTFKAIDSRVFFFREGFSNLLKIYAPPIMHGIIVFEHDKEQVVVKGFVNWSPLWLTLYFFLALPPARIADATIVIVLLFGISYSIQYFLFSKVCKFAAELCLNKEFLINSGGV